DGISNRMLVAAVVIALAVIILISVYIGAEMFHRNFEYDFAQDAFVVRKGILARKELIIPYKDIESAKVLRSGVHALDQVFGLTCVQVKAKGKSIIIPGITEPEVFLRRLMANVQGNEMIKNSEIYLSEREILMKLSADVKAIEEKVEQLVAEQKRQQAAQKPAAQNYPFEFLRTGREIESAKLVDIKTFSDLKKPDEDAPLQKKKRDGGK
ncbi:MAG: PH domain-containing protein, partial [Candidatus Micrarchaeota archaeon]|nr:PH domain-containing protein [Candidatus Micrarchaeota archaeon]